MWTPRLLELLAALGARATFFPIAARAAAHPQLIAEMASAGHAIGLHCEEHVRHSVRDLDWGRRDTSRGLGRLARLGVRPSLWRTPWGDLAPWSIEVARENNLRIVGWTVDTHDWRGGSSRDMFLRTRDALDAGAIVLAHDGIGPGARRGGAEETLAYVGIVAAHARSRRLKLQAIQ